MSLPSLDANSSLDVPVQPSSVESMAPTPMDTSSSTVVVTTSNNSTSTAQTPLATTNTIQNVGGSSIQTSVPTTTVATNLKSATTPSLSNTSNLAVGSASSGMSSLKNATLSGSSSTSISENSTQLLSRARLQDLVREIDPTEQLDDDVEELLMQLADDFVENTVSSACLFAKHRKANTIDVKDVQLHLERNWNMWIPGFGTDELRPYKRAAVTDAHKQRLALIKKTLKKY